MQPNQASKKRPMSPDKVASRVKALPRAINNLDTRLYTEGRQLAGEASNSKASDPRAHGSEAKSDRGGRQWSQWAQDFRATLQTMVYPTLAHELESWRRHRESEGWRGFIQARARVWARRGFAQGVEWTSQSMGWKLSGRVGEVTWRNPSASSALSPSQGYCEVDVTRASAGAVIDAVDLLLRRQLSEVFDLGIDEVSVERAELQFHNANSDGQASVGLRLGACAVEPNALRDSGLEVEDRTWRVTLPWTEAEREELRRQIWSARSRAHEKYVRTQVTAHVFEITEGEPVARRIADVELNLTFTLHSNLRLNLGS